MCKVKLSLTFSRNRMATTAYLRVSTGTQDLENQKLAILEYASRKKFPINEFVEVQISSRKKPHQRGIDGMLERLAPGDRLIVSELSRLGRSLGQVIHIVDELVKRKIRFTAIKESIHFEGKQDLQTKVMVALFACSPRSRESAHAKDWHPPAPRADCLAARRVCWESRGWMGKRKRSAFSCKSRSQRRPSPRLSASRGPPFTALSRQGGYAHILKRIFLHQSGRDPTWGIRSRNVIENCLAEI